MLLFTRDQLGPFQTVSTFDVELICTRVHTRIYVFDMLCDLTAALKKDTRPVYTPRLTWGMHNEKITHVVGR